MKTTDETNNSVKHNMVKNPKWQETDQLVGYGLVNMYDYSQMNYHNNVSLVGLAFYTGRRK